MLPLHLLLVALSPLVPDAAAAPTLPAHWPGVPWGISPDKPPHPTGCVPTGDSEHPWTCDERLGVHTYAVTYTYDGTGLWSGAATCNGRAACDVLRADLERAWGPCVAAPLTPGKDRVACTWIAKGRGAQWGVRDDEVGGMFFQLMDDAGYRAAWRAIGEGWWGYRFGDPEPDLEHLWCSPLPGDTEDAKEQTLYLCSTRLLPNAPLLLTYTAGSLTQVMVGCGDRDRCDALRARVAWAVGSPGKPRGQDSVTWTYRSSTITWAFTPSQTGVLSVNPRTPAPSVKR